MRVLVLALAAQAAALSNFPKSVPGGVRSAALGVRIGGQPAVVVAGGDTLYAWRADGAAPPGWPVFLENGAQESGAPAAADVDGDGRAELAVVSKAGKVWLVEGDGAVRNGFPVALGAAAAAGPSFADVDGDGRPELLAGDALGRVHAFERDGREAPGFPLAPLGSPVTSTLSSARFGGALALAFGCEDGKVHVVDVHGRELPGFPLRTAYTVSGAPAFGDVDDDGRLDLVVASQDFKVYAVDEAGRALAGFPVETGYRVYGGPALGDLDGDGRLDVVFASADGGVYAVSGRGEALPGFPVKVAPRLLAGVALGDLDLDGRLDVVVPTSDGQLAALSATGKPLAGYPEPVGGQDLAATPLLYDLAGDGALAAFVGTPAGSLVALRGKRGSAPAQVAWGGPAHDLARSGRFFPNPPRWRDLAVEPAKPTVKDGLRAKLRYVALDAPPGAAVPAPPVVWKRDGERVAELDGRRELAPGTARKGERWSFTVGRDESGEVTIADSAPAAPELRLDPAAPSRAADVELVVAKPAADPDGDAVRYRVEWLLDGEATGVTGTTFPGAKLRKGRRLAARVVPSDGELEGPPTVASALVADTAPGALAVALLPPHPRVSDAITVQVTRAPSDADGDALVLHHRFTIAGEPRNLALATGALPAGAAKKHQAIRVEVRAFDGELEGPPASAQVEIANTPPPAPRVTLVPAVARLGDGLTARVEAPPDADGDAVTVRYVWTRDGKKVDLPSGAARVPRELPKKGERWAVEVTASDGEASAAPVRAETTIADTPPGRASIALCDGPVKSGAAIAVRIARPAVDPDGDAVSYEYAWTVAGRPVEGGAALRAGLLRKHEVARVVVTPTDGAERGPPTAAECEAEDSAPTAPAVRIEPASPTAESGMRAVVVTPSSDHDGDAVRYAFRWYRDGLAAGEGEAVKPGALRHGERWRLVAIASDGERSSEPAFADAEVANTPPPTPQVSLDPAAPRAAAALRCLARAPEKDADGEPLRLRFAWQRDGAPVPAAADRAELPAGVARKGEKWRCEAWAEDGAAAGPRASAEAVVANSAPSAPKAVIEPEHPATGDALSCRLAAEAVDLDGDPVRYRYAWTRNGQPAQPGPDPAVIPGDRVKKGDRFRCAVTASDGSAESPPAEAVRDVGNGAPGEARVEVLPAAPLAGQVLRCAVAAEARDPDGDAVSYRFAWFKNGEPQRFAQTSQEVPSRLVKPGDRWRCAVTPTDGSAIGPSAASLDVAVGAPPPASGR